jgi:DNA-binding MarR family transcriptional regulator
MSAVELAQAERLKPQSLTRVLADLEEEGLIGRTRATADKRMWIIEMTSAGRATLAHDMAARRAWLMEAMGRSLDSTEQRLLTRAAELMLRLALESPPPSGKDP